MLMSMNKPILPIFYQRTNLYNSVFIALFDKLIGLIHIQQFFLKNYLSKSFRRTNPFESKTNFINEQTSLFQKRIRLE